MKMTIFTLFDRIKWCNKKLKILHHSTRYDQINPQTLALNERASKISDRNGLTAFFDWEKDGSTV